MSDHIVDANKMATPRTDAEACWPAAYDDSDTFSVDGGYVVSSFARTLEHELTAANAEIARLKAGGCARNQRTTQFCAEAVDLARKLEEANDRIRLLIAERDTARRQAEQHYNLRQEFAALLGTEDVDQGVKVVQALKSKVDYLQNWIRSLEVIESNTKAHRTWHGDLGWIHPGQCVYFGKEKPEGLR